MKHIFYIYVYLTFLYLRGIFIIIISDFFYFDILCLAQFTKHNSKQVNVGNEHEMAQSESNADLCWPCHKIGQGHHMVMIYKHIAVLTYDPETTCQVLLKSVHRFWKRRFLMGFYHIYGHGGHLGHVTWIIYKQIGIPSH